jgi:preprotein translocase subunit SecA
MPESYFLVPATRLTRSERQQDKRSSVNDAVHAAAGIGARWFTQPLHRYQRSVRKILAAEELLANLTDDELKQRGARLGYSLRRDGMTDRHLNSVFALVREVAYRTLGIKHFHVQVLGGLALYHGKTVEMQTGEGKTLTATLPACAAALSGIPVHVLTVNDYLARRDAEEMGPVYEFLGLSVGIVTHEESTAQRQLAYARDVVYCTNKELVFDYLKDSIILDGRSHPLHMYAETIKGNRALKKQLLLRGLYFAIVDEVDSVLLDEARNPLIISGHELHNSTHELMMNESMVIARELREATHFVVEPQVRTVTVTEQGEQRVLAHAAGLGSHWRGKLRAIELVRQALYALHLFERDRHYLIKDGAIAVIDEHTGRVMEDRRWERGLHELVEIKEECRMTKPRSTLARISFQNFFRKFHHLCGMSGTGIEAAAELWEVYRQQVVSIPTNVINRRVDLPGRVLDTLDEKWVAVMTRVRELHANGHPVLVGLTSVSASEQLSVLLEEEQLPHRLLNAKQDEDEAEIIAKAGQAGQITLATNMAGRGTDIKLTEVTRQTGGLHVILTEFHDSRRIDRQLAGRCARQGDVGTFETFVSMEDRLLNGDERSWIEKCLPRVPIRALRTPLVLSAMRRAQDRLEQRYRSARTELLKADEKQDELLSFVGNRM